MSVYHEADIQAFIQDAFGYEGNIAETSSKIVELFETLGVDMQFKGNVDEEKITGSFKNGVLKLALPKTAHHPKETKKIELN